MTTLQVALQKMGLTEMRSPREVWPVGTIVGVKRNEQGYITEVPDVCNPLLIMPNLIQEGQAGSYMRERTNTVSEIEKAAASGSIAMTGIVLSDLKANLGAGAKCVLDVSVSLSNSWILYADAVTLTRTARKLMSIPDCSENVRHYRNSGYEVTSLEKVFVADLAYTVSFSTDITEHESIRLSLLRAMAANLHAIYDASRNSLIRGAALTFGFSVPNKNVSPVPMN
jgi:hypothetical protein